MSDLTSMHGAHLSINRIMPLRYPSRIETITFPVFGMSWYGNPADGTSIVAYSGGGGSAKTGVFNKIITKINGVEQEAISTGPDVCVGVYVYQNPLTQKYWLVGAMSPSSVVRYSLPEGTLQGSAEIGEDGAATVTVNAMADTLALGSEKGPIHLFSIKDDSNDFVPIGICQGHVKATCAVSFALRTKLLVSSAKDGTAKVWNYETQTCLSTLECKLPDPVPPPKKRGPQPILVRGCAFGDLEGKVIYTVASRKRGDAYLYRWLSTGNNTYACDEQLKCSPDPISAMSLSADATMLALGSINGTITLYNAETWKVLKKFTGVHELPITCIAARPYSTPLQGDDEGVVMHAMSASADSKFALLTMQKRGPKQPAPAGGGGGGTSVFSLSMLFWIGLLSWAMYYIAQETQRKCQDEWNDKDMGKFADCFLHTVLIAPSSRPGILVPPH